MLRRSNINFALFLFLSDLALTDLALHAAKLMRLTLPYGEVKPQAPYFIFPAWLYVAVPGIWAAVFLIMSVYDSRRTLKAIDELQSIMVAVSFATLVWAGLAYFFLREFSRVLFVYFFFLDLAFLIGWRIILRLALRLWHGGWPHSAQRVAIVGAGKVGCRIAEMLLDYGWAGITLVGFLDDDRSKQVDLPTPPPILGTLDEAPQIVSGQRIDELIIALPLRAHKRLVELVLHMQRLPVRVHVVPDLFDLSFFRATIDEFGGIPMVGLRDPAIEGFPRLVKRAFDVLVASLALLLGWPAMIAIAVAIKLDSPGPVIFKQQRVGENGRLFWMYKFRSMVQDAEQRRDEVITQTDDGQLIHKHVDDPRVTRVGRFIRRASLDELPQLINVLKGEMSLVGPRPELPWLVERYAPWQRKRFAVPQGITGWWQVNGRSDKPMHLHTEEDLYYIQNYSLLLDIQIMWKTLGTLFKRKGAY